MRSQAVGPWSQRGGPPRGKREGWGWGVRSGLAAQSAPTYSSQSRGRYPWQVLGLQWA